MTHPEPQAAPPETDLRAEVRAAVHDAVYEALAIQRATIREKVMAAIAELPDYWDRDNYQTLVHVTRDDLTAAVAAVLEAENA
jgi:hypothetical protein